MNSLKFIRILIIHNILAFWRNPFFGTRLLHRVLSFLMLTYSIILIAIIGYHFEDICLQILKQKSCISFVNNLLPVLLYFQFTFKLFFYKFSPLISICYNLLPIRRSIIIKIYLARLLIDPIFLLLLIFYISLGTNWLIKSTTIGTILWLLSIIVSLIFINLLAAQIKFVISGALLNMTTSVISYSILTYILFHNKMFILRYISEKVYSSILEGNIFVFCLLVFAAVIHLMIFYNYLRCIYNRECNLEPIFFKNKIFHSFSSNSYYNLLLLELKLIFRNNITKFSLLISSVLVLLAMAALISMNSQQIDIIAHMLLVYIALGFLFISSYGTALFAWDGKYLPLLMTRDIPYSKIIASKWILLLIMILFHCGINLITFTFASPVTRHLLLIFTIYNSTIFIPMFIFKSLHNRNMIRLDSKWFHNNSLDSSPFLSFCLIIVMMVPFIIIALSDANQRIFASDAVLSIYLYVFGLAFFALFFYKQIFVFLLHHFINKKYKIIERAWR